MLYMICMLYIHNLLMSRFKIVMNHLSPAPMLGAPLEAMVSSRWWRKQNSRTALACEMCQEKVDMHFGLAVIACNYTVMYQIYGTYVYIIYMYI